MGNVYPASSNGRPCSSSPSAHIDGDWDTEVDTERAILREENARLRALVVKRSDIVLRNVVDQSSRPQFVPAGRPLAE